MAPVNKKYTIAIYIGFVLLTFSVLGYYLLFKKQKEYYTIKNVKVSAVQVVENSVGGYTITPFQRESKKLLGAFLLNFQKNMYLEKTLCGNCLVAQWNLESAEYNQK